MTTLGDQMLHLQQIKFVAKKLVIRFYAKSTFFCQFVSFLSTFLLDRLRNNGQLRFLNNSNVCTNATESFYNHCASQ